MCGCGKTREERAAAREQRLIAKQAAREAAQQQTAQK